MSKLLIVASIRAATRIEDRAQKHLGSRQKKIFSRQPYKLMCVKIRYTDRCGDPFGIRVAARTSTKQIKLSSLV
ncbi:MAG: hypothetical protein QNJ54_23540 [Prochloraceae cyanobacterium]|nr:hypothetical protein [Prochloraceae cyanobacterium]